MHDNDMEKKDKDFSLFQRPGVPPPKKKPVLLKTLETKQKRALDPETEAIFQKIASMEKDLEQKIEKICELSGMTRREVEKYIDDPSNFSKDKWSEVNQRVTEFEEKMYKQFGGQLKKKVLKKKKDQMSKERKGKTLGGRKGWIQM